MNNMKDVQSMMSEEMKARLLGAQQPMGMASGGMTSRKRPIDGKATRGKTKGRVC